MNKTDLKDGRRYRLTRDVANPRLDKRARLDVNHVPWSAGDVFRARVWDPDWDDSEKKGKTLGMQLEAVFIQGSPRKVYHSIGQYREGFEELCAALEEIPETAYDICVRVMVQERDVLNKLVSLGKLSLADVEAACKAVGDDYIAEET